MAALRRRTCSRTRADRRRLERERCEVEPGRPAFGSLDEVVDISGSSPSSRRSLRSSVGLGAREAELVGAQLDQRPVRAERRQRQRGLVPRREHELERGGRVIDEPGDAVARRAAREPVEVVENERGVAERGQRVDQLRQEDVDDRARSELLRRRRDGEARADFCGAPRGRTTTARPGRCRPRRASARRPAAAPSCASRQVPSSVVLPDPAGAATTVSLISGPARSRSTRRARMTVCSRRGGGCSLVISRGGEPARCRSSVVSPARFISIPEARERVP